MSREKFKLWVGKTDTAMPRGDVRLRIANRFNGCCARCRNKLVGSFDLDHVIPLEDGGVNAEGNLQPLCKPCHGMKTRGENSERAQVRRKAKAHLGIGYVKQKIASRGFPKKPKRRVEQLPMPARRLLWSVGKSNGD